MSRKYECVAGRVILRDGIEFVAIHRLTHPITGAGPSPVDCDEFAHLCADAPDLLRQRDELLEAAEFMVDHYETHGKVVGSLAIDSLRNAIANARREGGKR